MRCSESNERDTFDLRRYIRPSKHLGIDFAVQRTALPCNILNGNTINNTATATNASILLPVQNGAANACRSSGVKFVRVQLALVYADLNRIDPAPNCVLRGEYYIQLPQDTVDLVNAAGTAYRLTTFNGPADLRTLTMDNIRLLILSATHQDAPYDLLELVFNLTSCRTNSTVI